jgi:hypothetical protein
MHRRAMLSNLDARRIELATSFSGAARVRRNTPQTFCI